MATDKVGMRGYRKVKQRQFYGTCTVCKSEIFTTFDWWWEIVLKVHA